MVSLLWLFSLLLSAPSVSQNQNLTINPSQGDYQYQLTNNTRVTYERMFQDYQYINQYKYLRFDTAFNAKDHVHLEYLKPIESCQDACAVNDKCRGIYYFYYYNISICYGLSDLGNSVVTETPNWSMKKLVQHIYNQDNHTIEGYAYTNDNYHTNLTIYLDENHNGRLDDFEKSTMTDTDGHFQFNGLVTGNYIVSEVLPLECRQKYPGKFGTTRNLELEVNEYADLVMEYYDNNEGHIIGPYGGNNFTDDINFKVNFSHVLDGSKETWLSLGQGSYIVLGFSELGIINTPGNDFYIYESSFNKEYANVYVSHDNIDYTFLQKVTKSDRGIIGLDLSIINYDKVVRYVKIESLSNIGTSVGFDLGYLQVDDTSITLPFNSYYVSTEDKDVLIFDNDCTYSTPCEVYCAINHNWFNNIESCKTGCQIFNRRHTCLCSMLEFDIRNSTTLFNGTIFKDDICAKGCFYRVAQEIYPSYSFVENRIGNFDYITYVYDNCFDVMCFNDVYMKCNQMNECSAFSFDTETKKGYLYSYGTGRISYMKGLMTFL